MRLLRLTGSAFLTGFSGALMPGPMLALTIGQVAAQGFGAVLLICGGHALLELVTVALLVMGLRAVIERPAVRGGIGLVGGAALVYMGADMIRSAPHLQLALTQGGAAALPWAKLLLAGASVCAANPYFFGWWATIGSGQLAQFAPRTPAEYGAFYLGHEASDLVWFGFVALLVVSGRGLLPTTVYQGVIVACGVAVILLGGAFLWAGLKCLRGRPTTSASAEATGG